MSHRCQQLDFAIAKTTQEIQNVSEYSSDDEFIENMNTFRHFARIYSAAKIHNVDVTNEHELASHFFMVITELCKSIDTHKILFKNDLSKYGLLRLISICYVYAIERNLGASEKKHSAFIYIFGDEIASPSLQKAQDLSDEWMIDVYDDMELSRQFQGLCLTLARWMDFQTIEYKDTWSERVLITLLSSCLKFAMN